MSSQTKEFIDPADILAVQVACKGCHLVMAVPLAEAERLLKFITCPVCNERWLQVGSSTLVPDLENCVAALNSAIAALQRWPGLLDAANAKGFALTLEIVRSEKTK